MIFLFDFDEVFVNINPPALEYLNKKLNTQYTSKDLTKWDFYDAPDRNPHFLEFLSQPDMYQKAAIPNWDMINVLKKMVEMNQKAVIITASVEGSEASKYQFIKENMSFFDRKNLFTVNSSTPYKNKSDVLEHLQLSYKEPIVLIDDGVHNVLDMMADIKHKDKLDKLMGEFYMLKKLKKFNNPYHDFIYGVIPELEYNKSLEEGKRIFKLKDTADIWGIFDKIHDNHQLRLNAKRGDIFNYIHNILDAYPIDNNFSVQSVSNNCGFIVSYLMSNYHSHNETSKTKDVQDEVEKFSKNFNRENTITLFESNVLSSVTQLMIKFEAIIEQFSHTESDKMPLTQKMIDAVFKKSDEKFGNDVLYKDMKSLILLHINPFDSIQNITDHKRVAENFGLFDIQQDLFSNTLLNHIIGYSKDNIKLSQIITDNLTLMSMQEQAKLIKTLKHAGMVSDIHFEDLETLKKDEISYTLFKQSIFSDILMAFNKNIKIDIQSHQFKNKIEYENIVIIKNQEVEDIRQFFLNHQEIISKDKHNKKSLKA